MDDETSVDPQAGRSPLRWRRRRKVADDVAAAIMGEEGTFFWKGALRKEEENRSMGA